MWWKFEKNTEQYWLQHFKFFPRPDISLECSYREFCHSISLNTKNSSQIYRNWDFIIPAKWVFISVAETKVATVFLCFLLLACDSSADTPIFLILMIFLQSLQYTVVVTGWDCNQFSRSWFCVPGGLELTFFWHVSYICSVSTTKWKFQLNHIRKLKSFFVCINHTSQTALVCKSWPNKFSNYSSAWNIQQHIQQQNSRNSKKNSEFKGPFWHLKKFEEFSRNSRNTRTAGHPEIIYKP